MMRYYLAVSPIEDLPSVLHQIPQFEADAQKAAGPVLSASARVRALALRLPICRTLAPNVSAKLTMTHAAPLPVRARGSVVSSDPWLYLKGK